MAGVNEAFKTRNLTTTICNFLASFTPIYKDMQPTIVPQSLNFNDFDSTNNTLGPVAVMLKIPTCTIQK